MFYHIIFFMHYIKYLIFTNVYFSYSPTNAIFYEDMNELLVNNANIATEFTSNDYKSLPTCYLIPWINRRRAKLAYHVGIESYNSPRLLHAGTGKSLDYFMDKEIHYCEHPSTFKTGDVTGCMKVATSLSNFCQNIYFKGYSRLSEFKYVGVSQIDPVQEYWTGLSGVNCGTVESCHDNTNGKYIRTTNSAIVSGSCTTPRKMLCITEITAPASQFIDIDTAPTNAPTRRPDYIPHWEVILSYARFPGVGYQHEQPVFQNVGNNYWQSILEIALCQDKGEPFLYRSSMDISYFRNTYMVKDPINNILMPVYFENLDKTKIPIADSMGHFCSSFLTNGIPTFNTNQNGNIQYIWTGMTHDCKGSNHCNDWTFNHSPLTGK